WHIECSAMSWKHLGEVFDIHGGGIDLIFPHHENEVAQNLCAFGHNVMANVWMHNGFLQVEGQKMSKSLGNFVTIHELLETEKFGGRKWPGDVLRLAMLKTHYREPIDFSIRKLEEAETNLRSWRSAIDQFSDLPPRAVDQNLLGKLADDLNTSDVIARMHVLTGYAKGSVSYSRGGDAAPDNLKPDEAAASLKSSLEFLGFSADQQRELLNVDEDRVNSLIASRLEARKAKNWAESDRIRDELAAMGIAIKDNKDGTTSWEVKR
ncbi:MAG: class I tRNA ligase family protein, partial [Alphaproteobacteria bacterium]|nr:class I tRNA ligase family protein [Alphaproteobacteria bacterium]